MNGRTMIRTEIGHAMGLPDHHRSRPFRREDVNGRVVDVVCGYDPRAYQPQRSEYHGYPALRTPICNTDCNPDGNMGNSGLTGLLQPGGSMPEPVIQKAFYGCRLIALT